MVARPASKRGDRALLTREAFAARGDQSSDHLRADVGGADPRFGGGNRGGRGGLGGAQLARFVAGAGGGGLEPGDLAVGVGRFGPGAGQRQVDRLGGAASGALPAARSSGAAMMRAERRMRLPFTMIGVVRKDRGGAKQLFGEHRADQQVRPCRRAERQQQVGICANVLAVTVGGADQEARLALAIVAPGFEFLGERHRRQRFARVRRGRW